MNPKVTFQTCVNSACSKLYQTSFEFVCQILGKKELCKVCFVDAKTINLKFLEYHRFYKTKYLVDSFYIFLCPLAELVTLSSSMPLPYTCQEQPGDTQQLSPTLALLSISKHVYGRDIDEESVTSSAKGQRNI